MPIASIKTLILVVLTASVLIRPDGGAAPLANNNVIPFIEMENVPLSDAIRQLARQAHLNLLLDPRLSEPPFARLTVSVRWQGVTARDALVALLDNYGLVLVEL
jgi:hypothetical protein